MSEFDMQNEEAFSMCHVNHQRASALRSVCIPLPALNGEQEDEEEAAEVYMDCEDGEEVDDCDFTEEQEEPRAMTSSIPVLAFFGLQILAIIVIALLL